ncbi:hypothetical protein Psuf_047150 [Phytohabitans suffuscus]|uniref:Uncharacterized protein n=1 Tax=Phytohabitans suffuscus TaxID=624315 RepID=A0A6F8YMR0_9ACTN|nr:hypothetical protein Psuf_047150 [Phytohabitans suffuscus]
MADAGPAKLRRGGEAEASWKDDEPASTHDADWPESDNADQPTGDKADRRRSDKADRPGGGRASRRGTDEADQPGDDEAGVAARDGGSSRHDHGEGADEGRAKPRGSLPVPAFEPFGPPAKAGPGRLRRKKPRQARPPKDRPSTVVSGWCVTPDQRPSGVRVRVCP